MKTYTIPLTEIVFLGLTGSLLEVDGTHSVENYKEKEWENVGENGEDDDIISGNKSSLWDTSSH